MNETQGQSSALALYFSEVDGGKLLTKQQEIELAKKIDKAKYKNNKGDKNETKFWRDDVDLTTLSEAKKARNKLINSNLRLVASVAKKFQGQGCELEDLIQEGNIGLMDGIDRFDYTRNLKISTYATWWIRQRIERLISNHGRTVRVPVHVQTLSSKLKPLLETYTKEFNCYPSLDEVKTMLDCSEEMAKAALNAISQNPTITLDHTAGNQDGTADDDLHSYFEDEDATNPLDLISHQELVKIIREVIKTLPARDEKILRLRFGITEDPTDHNIFPITKEEADNLKGRKSKGE